MLASSTSAPKLFSSPRSFLGLRAFVVPSAAELFSSGSGRIRHFPHGRPVCVRWRMTASCDYISLRRGALAKTEQANGPPTSPKIAVHRRFCSAVAGGTRPRPGLRLREQPSVLRNYSSIDESRGSVDPRSRGLIFTLARSTRDTFPNLCPLCQLERHQWEQGPISSSREVNARMPRLREPILPQLIP
jgi:hypothetical protein